ncbi:MFS family permease [Microbacterium resistens]|uniref:MFS family permease n=1 Tax=Microbacterium resistens TaxID=156977 RepID=A0ABU1SC54_9MICO|nr:MFS transporter [Microbacterium resistens]MDR6867189.1 MFS family permease [Microbacterium resistens]
MTASPPARTAVLATAFAFLIVMAGTTLPTPLYAIYAEQLSFAPLMVTLLFAVYAFGVVAALVVFGRLSDVIGRRPVLIAAVVLAILSTALFLLPPALPVLFAARVLSGLAAGLMSGTGTAAIIDLFPAARRASAGTLAVAVNAGGLALGTLGAGVLSALVAAPLVVPYAVYLALSVLALLGLIVLVPAPRVAAGARFRVQRVSVPARIRAPFVRAVLAAGSGFAVLGVLTATSALFLAGSLHLASHLLAGAVVGIAFFGMAVGQILARRMTAHRALVTGCLGLVASAAMLGLAFAVTGLAWLIASAVVTGVAGGLCMNAAIGTTVERVEPAERGAVSSAFFAGVYLMLAVPAIIVGILAGATSLSAAGLVLAIAVAVLALVVACVELGARGTGTTPEPGV